MRLKIRTKVFLIGVLVTVAIMTIAFFLSFSVYKSQAYQNLLSEVNGSVDNLRTYFLDSIQQSELSNVKDYVLNEYNQSPTTSESEDIDQRHEYFQDKYGQLYTTDGLGLSADKAKRQTDYRNLSTFILYAVRQINSKTAFVAYKDAERNRYVYLIDYYYALGDNYNAYTRFPGDYYQITEKDKGYFNHKDKSEFVYDDYYLDGFTMKYTDVYDEGNYICTVFVEYDENTVIASMGSFINTEIIALSVAAVIMVIIFVLLSHFAFTKNISKLRLSTKEFTDKAVKGETLSAINPNVKSKDELGELSASFINLENELISYTERIANEAKEKERINAELSIASEIQSAELPACAFADGKVKVVADYTSAKEVGGDFYDYFYIDKNRFAVVIADVSGKGVPAALFMMKAKGLIRNKLKETGDVEKTAFEVNNLLLENNKSGHFITAFIGVIDLTTRKMKCVSTGHEKPYFIGEKAEKLNVESNFILGGQKNFVYKADEFDVKGKKLFLFTDGLNEAINDKYEEFGYQRIEQALSTAESSDANILAGVKSALKDFVGANEAFDDITLMIIDVNGAKLQAEFNKPDYGIIERVTDTFNAEFSFIDKDTIGMLDVIIDEMLNNLISYEKTDDLKVGFSAFIKGDSIVMEFIGNGEKFDPLSVKEKYISEGQENVSVGGFGITITKSFSDEISYARKNNQNVITVVKYFNRDKIKH